MKKNIHETFLYMYIMKLLQLYTYQDLISSASQMSHEGTSLIASLFQEGLIIHQRTHQAREILIGIDFKTSPDFSKP